MFERRTCGEVLKGGPVGWDACETVATLGAGTLWMQFRSGFRLVCVISGVVGAKQKPLPPWKRGPKIVIQ